MANPEHLSKLTGGDEAWANWRAAHPEVEPDLRGAQLAGKDLGNSDLISADLSEANLCRARLANCQMAGTILAGADLTGAELPGTVSQQLDNLDNVKEISSNAQKLFIAMLAACLYCWLTIAATTDLNLIADRATSSLPIIQTTIPIVGFFYVAPLLLLGVFFYLHFYLQKLWQELSILPAIFPDGKPLYAKIDPWLLNDLVRIYRPTLKGRTPFLARLQLWISVLLAWWVVPLTLLLFWVRYLVCHELIGTVFHSIAAAVAISSAIFLYRLARNTLRRVEPGPSSRPAATPRHTWLPPVATGVMTAASLIVLSLGGIMGARSGTVEDNYWPDQAGPRSWVPKAMAFFRFSPFANLRTAELSVKPSDWSIANDKAKTAVTGVQLSSSDLQFADMRASFLPNSLLTGANLEEADLLGADIELAVMMGTNLTGASLANANLRGASLARANMERADIKYADFEGAQGLTKTQLLAADNWCEALYDAEQLSMLDLPHNNNDQVMIWRHFDETNSSAGTPTTYEAAREADLRRFSAAPSIEPVATKDQIKATTAASGAKIENGKFSHYTVPEIAKIYDFPTGLNGAGQTIGIIELDGGYRDSDLDKYFHDLNLQKPKVSSVSVNGHMNSPSPNYFGGSDGQVEGDIEIVGAAAPGAEVVVYFTSDDSSGYLNAIRAAEQDKIHHLTVLLIDWGAPENTGQWTATDLRTIDAALEAAKTRNITVVVASGDNGARDKATDKRLRVDFPASSPWVLSVGGTKLVGALGSSNFSEVVWNDGEMGGASGGGVSEVFEEPSWQSHIRVPRSLSARPGRAVPDVAMNASPQSGYALFIDGQYGVLGGTSIAAPMWAALIALLNQGLGRNIGFINPLLYQKLAPAGLFRSITRGHNGIGELSGYCAGPGWNAATGWGTPDGARMLQALKSLPTVDFEFADRINAALPRPSSGRVQTLPGG